MKKREEKSIFGTAKHYKVLVKKKKENPFKFILSVLSYALFIFLLLIGGALLVYVVDLKVKEAKGIAHVPKYNAYVVLTGSMLPEIKVNDVVVTKRVESSELKVRDIITFISSDSRFKGIIITHRIRNVYVDPATGEYSFETKGDNNNVADLALVKENNILGRVFLRVPKLGYIQQFLASKAGWIIAILVPCLAVLSYDILKLIKILRKRQKSRNIKMTIVN